MKIIIAGAGNVGTHLAKLLSREKQDIILMDDDEEKLTALSSNFDLLTVTASPSSISGLKEVGVKEADLFIAVTPDESRNMTACMLGGMGSAVLEFMADHEYTPTVKRIGIPDKFVQHGTIAQLYQLCGMDEDSITKELLKQCALQLSMSGVKELTN